LSTASTPPGGAPPRGAPPRPFGALFGHQSVGADIITGVRELPDIEASTGPRICDRHHNDPEPIATDAPDSGWRLFHSPIGRNREPVSKLEEFERLAREEFAGRIDVAVMKFCYVDVTAATAVSELFQTYITRLGALGDALPHIRFLHMTVPLRVVQPAWRATLKRMLGRPDLEVEHNRAREEFNRRLRDSVDPSTLFDLAAMASESSVNHQQSRSLRADWTNDGGHLNATGRKIVARAFLQFIQSKRPAVCP
jgi:hypothetical protein